MPSAATGCRSEGFAGYAVHRIRGAILDELRSRLATAPAATEISSDERSESRNAQKTGMEPEWSELAVEGIS